MTAKTRSSKARSKAAPPPGAHRSAPDADARRQRPALPARSRIVLKVGSALLAQGGSRYFSSLAAQLADAWDRKKRQLVLVSSGAIALGLSVMGLQRRPSRLNALQAAAAAGQPELIRRWQKALHRYGIPVGQVLLTHADLADRERFLNARHAVKELFSHGVVPVINENDSVATDEIRVGDNDNLSAQVASMVGADLLIILTTVDGVYDANPEIHPSAKRIPIVREPADVAAFARGAGSSGLGVGGMRTKIEAAQAAVKRSIPVVIAHGRTPKVLSRILAGDDVGTLFIPSHPVPSRKHWISFTLRPKGTLHIDGGAAAALCSAGKSLLPSGLVRVDGTFARGAMVEISGPQGVVARGLAAYDSAALSRLCGVKSRDIAKILGYVETPEIVHRDDLALEPTRQGQAQNVDNGNA